MASIIDRRKNGRGKSTENRQKFLKRVHGAIKEQMPKILAKRKLKNYVAGGARIKVKKGISEPWFRHGHGGNKDYVVPGNKEYVPGDLIPRQPGGGGKHDASDEGEGLDDFFVEISQEEFLKYFFEDLELPNLLKTQI